MIIDADVVTLSRLQFALTALYHFLFVPLTLGLVWMLAIMESVYVMTGREVWKRMVQFWGVLFGINFAMGVATGVTMEFQFGMNWAYYSQYVGDIFGAPLAIEGMMAFFLEATLIGVFFIAGRNGRRGSHRAAPPPSPPANTTPRPTRDPRSHRARWRSWAAHWPEWSGRRRRETSQP